MAPSDNTPEQAPKKASAAKAKKVAAPNAAAPARAKQTRSAQKAEPAQAASSSTATLQITELRPAKGATKTKLRVGRGRASGAGKTSNRGHNGEGQRAGRSKKRGFEGGQMPAYRKMPKIGKFFQPLTLEWLAINVGDLDRVLGSDVTEVTYDWLRQQGILKQRQAGLRLLGNGELKRALVIEAHHASASAKAKLEAAGGKLNLISA